MVVIVGVIFKWCKTMVRKKTEFLAIGVTFRQALVIWCVVMKSWVTLFLTRFVRMAHSVAKFATVNPIAGEVDGKKSLSSATGEQTRNHAQC